MILLIFLAVLSLGACSNSVPASAPVPVFYPFGFTGDEEIFIESAMFADEMGYFPVDESLRQWFFSYLLTLEETTFTEDSEVTYADFCSAGESIKVKIGDIVMGYGATFDDETGLYINGMIPLEREDIGYVAALTERPLLFQLVKRDGITICEHLPEGKLLETKFWVSNRVTMDVRLTYTGKYVVEADGARLVMNPARSPYSQYSGLPFLGDADPAKRIYTLYDENREPLLLIASTYQHNTGYGTLDQWALYRLTDGKFYELDMVPGQEEALQCTLLRERDDFFLYFPYFDRKLPLDYRDFTLDKENAKEDAVRIYENYKAGNSLDKVFYVNDALLMVEYAEHEEHEAFGRIIMEYSLGGPLSYRQGSVKVSYEATSKGLEVRGIW